MGQGGCIRVKVVVFEQNGCNQARWLQWGKVVVFGEKWFNLGKWLYSS